MSEPRIDILRLMGQVRRQLDLIPLSGEITARNEDVGESPSRTFSNQSLVSYAIAAQRAIITEVKAQHLPEGVSLPVHTDTLPLASFYAKLDSTGYELVEPLAVWREFDGVMYRCRRRDPSEHNYLQSSGRQATPMYPIYMWDDDELRVFPEGSGNIKIRFISIPRYVPSASFNNLGVYLWQSPGTSIPTSTLALGERLIGPVLMRTCAFAEQALIDETPSRLRFVRFYEGMYQVLVSPFRKSRRLGSLDEYQNGQRFDDDHVEVE